MNAVEISVNPERSWNCPLLQQLRWSYLHSDSSEVMRCQQLLLNAEVDPNMCMNTSSGCSVFMNVVRYSPIVGAFPQYMNVQAHANYVKESVQMYMNFTGHLIDLECSDALGSTALLIALQAVYHFPKSGKDELNKVTLLLDRGADVMAQDHFGKGVFHQFFPYEDCASDLGDDVWFNNEMFTEDVAWIERHELMGTLRLLLKRGADKHAIDSNGCSVSQAAYGAGLGAVWYGALIDAGFDAEEIFSHLYEEVPEARCFCGRPRAQKRLYARDRPCEVHVKDILNCTHNEEFRERGNGIDEPSSMIGCEASARVSPVSHKDNEYGSYADWGIADSDKTRFERTASPILEGSW